MLLRQRLTTYGITTTAIAAVGLAIWFKPWKSQDYDCCAAPTPQTTAHRVDLVFAVDTTGSMGGLLDGAKRTVWSIATHIKQTDPQADLHVGLVAYRDYGQGDDYTTKDFPLSGDMDAVFAELSSYVAAGGGDVPEDVDAALYDAVHKMQWRDGAKKLVFLVGDAPPASRGEVPRFDVSVREAASLQIAVNTVRCGEDPDTAQAWKQIASIGHGEFSTIRQDGGVNQVATPYDDKLRELSATVDNSAVIYGDSAVHSSYRASMGAAATAPAAAAADRAAYYKDGTRNEADVLGKVTSGELSIDALDEQKLPPDIRAMPKATRKAEIDRRADARDKALQEIQQLNEQRGAYLEKNKAAGSAGFDDAVNATVTKELK